MRKLTTKEVKERLSVINPDIEILGDYVNSRSPLLSKCKICDYQWSSSWDNLKKGKCPSCSDSKRYSTEDIKIQLASITPDIEILSEYKNRKTLLLCYCNKCKRKWTESFMSLRKNFKTEGCNECNRKTGYGSGTYNIKKAELNKEEWQKIPAIIYKIKMFNEIEDFYKIGITTKTVEKRFGKTLPYSFEIIWQKNVNLYDAIIEEQLFHLENKYNSYLPNKKFDGYTECYKTTETHV